MLNDYAQTGQLPKWAEDNGEAYIMVGDPADSIIADAYAFGATRLRYGQSVEGHGRPRPRANNIRPGLSIYETDGYLPIDGTYGCCNFYGPVSTQEEYDTADNSIAQFAADARATDQVGADLRHAGPELAERLQPGIRFRAAEGKLGQFQPGFTPDLADGLRRGRLLCLHGHGPLRRRRASSPPRAATRRGSTT